MIDDIKQKLLEGNNKYQWRIVQETERITNRSKLKYPTLILTCMDPRIDVHRIFQLEPGDVFVLKNAGNIFTEDVLRSIIIAIYEYNIKYIVILGHLDCGMTKVNLSKLRDKLSKPILKKVSRYATSLELSLQMYFKPFVDEIKNIKNQIEYLTEELPSFIKIAGFLYDPHSGWVFDLEELRRYSFTENFMRDYKKIIDNKKLKLIDYFESIEKEIVNEPSIETTESPEPEVQDISKKKAEKAELIQDKLSFMDNTNIKGINILKEQEDFIKNYQIALQSIQKIKPPKIYIPKIKVKIPKVYKMEKKK